jgi:tRNA pseudouridine55 synthase
MYSAIKVKGQPLYKLARMGIEIQRAERVIKIYGIDLLRFDQPYLVLKISCSKGTYIRTLCDDIGKALHVGAHMISLKRTRVGKFRIEDSASLEELKYVKDAIHSIDSAISHLNEIMLDEESYHKTRKGMPVIMITAKLPLKHIKHYVRLKGPENELFAIGRLEQDRITVERLLN